MDRPKLLALARYVFSGPGNHDHEIRGIWDVSNEGTLGGRACYVCAAGELLARELGLDAAPRRSAGERPPPGEIADLVAAEQDRLEREHAYAIELARAEWDDWKRRSGKQSRVTLRAARKP